MARPKKVTLSPEPHHREWQSVFRWAILGAYVTRYVKRGPERWRHIRDAALALGLDETLAVRLYSGYLAKAA